MNNWHTHSKISNTACAFCHILEWKSSIEEARHDVDAAADLRYDAIPGVLHRIRELEAKKKEQEDASESPLLVETVTPAHIAEVVSRWTGIPVSKLSQGEKTKLLHLESELRKRVIGQEEAASAVARAVLRSAAGLARRNQPTGSFLFAGPTGVGKTELAGWGCQGFVGVGAASGSMM